MKTPRTNLAKAYDELRGLHLEMSTEQYILVGQIMYDLANKEFKSGLKSGEEIFKTK
tara:strand:+ start:327 stop:497 length:171 start_codon:yes stop_codon:yes gene_type:complete